MSHLFAGFAVVYITSMTTQYEFWGIQSLITFNLDFKLAAVDSAAATQETVKIF